MLDKRKLLFLKSTDELTSILNTDNVNNYSEIHYNIIYDILENRKTTANGLDKVLKDGYWWPLESKRKVDFDGRKIIVPQRSRTNTFGYNEMPWYASAAVYFITQPKENYELKYILGILNSKLIYKWLFYRGKRKGDMLELYQKPLSEIPIAKAKEEQQNVIVEIVDQILQKKKQKEETKLLENQIDLMVYKLYDLTYEEVKIVDAEFDKVLSEFGLSKEDYERMSLEKLGKL